MTRSEGLACESCKPSPPSSTPRCVPSQPTTNNNMKASQPQDNLATDGPIQDLSIIGNTIEDDPEENDSHGPILTPLLILSSQTFNSATPNHLLRLPFGRLIIENALIALHSAVPYARTIYVYAPTPLDAQTAQLLSNPDSIFTSDAPLSHGHDHDDHEIYIPMINLISSHDPAFSYDHATNALYAAHNILPKARWLVMDCDYAMLPAPALQQLALEYETPVTCFVNGEDVVQPLLGIWSAEALEVLREAEGWDGNGNKKLRYVMESCKMVRPLREEWILKPRTRKEWEAVTREK